MSKHPRALTVLGLIALAMLGQAWADDPTADQQAADAPVHTETSETPQTVNAATPAPAPGAPLTEASKGDAVETPPVAAAALAEPENAQNSASVQAPANNAGRTTNAAAIASRGQGQKPPVADNGKNKPAETITEADAPVRPIPPTPETAPMQMTTSKLLALADTSQKADSYPQSLADTNATKPDALYTALEMVLLGLGVTALLMAAVSKVLSMRASARAKPASTQPPRQLVQRPVQQPIAPILSLGAFEGTPMPKRPQPKEFMPRFQHIASTELLDLAHRLAEEQASPTAIVQALLDLELPIHPLSVEQAGVISVAGNSAKGWNEDSALAFRVQHYLLGECDVLMVFDGMGGLRDGKLASKLAALTMAIELLRTPDTLTSDWKVHLAAAFERVNRRFKKASEARYGVVDSDAMRSTAIVLLANKQRYVVGYQGDGQAHVRRADGSVHSLLQAHKGAASNVITHSLGPRPDGQASVSCHDRLAGDLVYIASDGFDPLPADQALAFLHTHSGVHALQQVAQGLTDVALAQRDAHGPIADDNMSLVALKTPQVDKNDVAHAQQQHQPATLPVYGDRLT